MRVNQRNDADLLGFIRHVAAAFASYYADPGVVDLKFLRLTRTP